MSGRRLRYAKTAATGVANALKEGDRLSIVSFSDEAAVHIAQLEMSDGNRVRAVDAIGRLQTSGSTNLSDGWFTGVEQVAAADREGSINRVVILSDGKANQGILDVDVLSRHAAELRNRGVTTSTVGIGDDYESVFLQAIATAGGGRERGLDDQPPGSGIGDVARIRAGAVGAKPGDDRYRRAHGWAEAQRRDQDGSAVWDAQPITALRD
jgi:Ca-activated chloride channel family protein